MLLPHTFVVVAQLAEQLLLKPEIRGSNPNISQKENQIILIVTCLEKMKRVNKKQ